MANFDQAIAIILQQEGGATFTDDPLDAGGATKYGITLNFLAHITQLGLFNGDLTGYGKVEVDDVRALTEAQAKTIYEITFWTAYQYGAINDQAIATKIFSLAVNMPVTNAHKCLQRAIRAVTGKAITEDGILGNVTLALTNQCDPKTLLAALKSEAAGYYRSLHILGANKFINGWLNRAYA